MRTLTKSVISSSGGRSITPCDWIPATSTAKYGVFAQIRLGAHVRSASIIRALVYPIEQAILSHHGRYTAYVIGTQTSAMPVQIYRVLGIGIDGKRLVGLGKREMTIVLIGRVTCAKSGIHAIPPGIGERSANGSHTI